MGEQENGHAGRKGRRRRRGRVTRRVADGVADALRVFLPQPRPAVVPIPVRVRSTRA